MKNYRIECKKAGDFKLPVLGLGTWQMGGREKRNPRNDDERDITAIRRAVDSGITHIDTAELYASGHAEKLLGEAIRKYDREKLLITTKVRSENLHYDDVIKSLKASLARMGLKYVDLYLIHWHNGLIPLCETMKAMDFLLENELTRFIGVSNFHIPLLEEAMSHTKYQIVNNQIHYNLGVRNYEENGTLDFCQKNQILVTAYRSTDKGSFIKGKNPLLDQIAEKYQKTPIQVAIRWIIEKPNVVTIFKTSNPDHLQENLGALGWRLNSEDIKQLDKNFPKHDGIMMPDKPI